MDPWQLRPSGALTNAVLPVGAVQVACTSMLQVAHLFSESLRYCNTLATALILRKCRLLERPLML
jgi:hypothetical protein